MEQNEGVKEVDDDDDDDDDNPREELKPIDEEERKLLAKAFSTDSNKDAWKTLGKKLGFEEDEVSKLKPNNLVFEYLLLFLKNLFPT